MQIQQKNGWWVYACTALFLALNLFCIYNEFYVLSVLPIAVILVAAAFFALDKLLLIIAFLAPLSVPLSEIIEGLPIDMFLPTEPLLAGIMMLFIFKIISEKRFDKRILTHPVSITIYIYLAWMLITCIMSEDPFVSFKFLLSRLWFIIPLYFIMTQVFRKDEKNAKTFVILYAVALCIVVVYALVRHAKYGIFDQKIAHWSANPFYKDHTSYGALLAFYIPPVIALSFSKLIDPRKRATFMFMAALLIVGIIFSYTRAAWLSLVGGFGIWCCHKLKIKFTTIVAIIGVAAIGFFTFGDMLMRDLKTNDQDSSTDFVEHLQSMANISTDASNMERINRWNCAGRMFLERPVFGWGPGTYMFYYAPFQISYEKTIISTNEGDMGNAHSEYLGPLAEEGVLGPITLLAIMVATIITGFRAIRRTRANHPMLYTIGLAAIIGLFTYYFHGVLNDFLDTDKASVPFWGFTALLVAIDVYYSDEKKDEAVAVEQGGDQA